MGDAFLDGLPPLDGPDPFQGLPERPPGDDGQASAFDRLRGLGSEVGYMRRIDGDREFVWVDSQARATLGVDPSRVLDDARIWDGHVCHDDGPAAGPTDSPEPVLDGPAVVRRLRWQRPDGTVVTLEERSAVARDHDGTVLQVGVVRAIDELARAEARLAAEKERLEMVLHETRLGVWDWDMVGQSVTVDRNWADVTATPADAPIPLSQWWSMLHPDDVADAEELLERHLGDELAQFDGEYRVRHADGPWVWVHDRGKVVEWATDGTPLRMAGIREDITRRRSSEEAMRGEMLVDPLTRLGNRRLMDARLDELVVGARFDDSTFAVLLVDVDHFKAVNDAHGHLSGDAALRAIAECITAAIRPTDIAIRHAGDEFCVLLPDVSPEGAELVAERLLRRIRAAGILGHLEHGPLTVSVGAAHSGEVDHLDEESVVRLADQRLYEAKRSGRNHVCAA